MNTSKMAHFIAVSLTLLLAWAAVAQEPEELDESEAERIAELFRNPVKINTAPRSRLEECSLFTHYQVESIMDYRSRNGDILSEAELASLDGFSQHIVSALSGMIDFGTLVSPGRSSAGRKCRTSIYAGGTLKMQTDEVLTPGYFAKVQFSMGNRLSLNAGVRNGDWSASGTWYGAGHLEKIVIGDFNARYGQGLTMWSGFSLSGLSSTAAFSKRATGISGCSTYSGNYSIRGAGLQMRWGDVCISGFGSVDALFGGNASFRRKNLDLGISLCWSKDYARSGLDFKYSVMGWDFWGEGIYDFHTHMFAGIGGFQWNLDYCKSLVLLLRHYPEGLASGLSGAARASSKASGETAVSLGAAFGGLSSTLDAAALYGKYLQFKSITVYSFPIGDYLGARVRAAFRLRPETESTFKTDIRADLMFSQNQWRINARIDYVRCRSNAALLYVESGCVNDASAFWLRVSGFHIDNWDDRIYVYERDAPGTFSSPAYYGRGVSADCYISWKINRHSSLYGRVCCLHRFNDNNWKLGFRLQYVLKL